MELYSLIFCMHRVYHWNSLCIFEMFKTDTFICVKQQLILWFIQILSKKTLQISGLWFIKLSNAFVFLDTELMAISILYGQSEVLDQFELCSCVFSHVTSSRLIIIFNFSFLYIISVLLCSLYQHLCCIDMILRHQAIAVFYYHLHPMQPC